MTTVAMNAIPGLVTKRSIAQEGATMEWIDGNLGSKVTMKYPAVYMMGPKAHGEILSIAFAGHGQHQDAGGKVGADGQAHFGGPLRGIPALNNRNMRRRI